MYTLRSHMSVVEYTCVFHWPTTTESSKSKLRQVRIISPILQNQFIFKTNSS